MPRGLPCVEEPMAANSIRVVAAVVEQSGLYLITQRRAEAVLGGLWEFPGGKVEPGEEDTTALRRELRERLDVEAVVGAKLAERHTAYSDYEVVLVLYAVRLDAATPPRPVRVREVRWVPSSELDQYPFPAADQKTMDTLLGIER